MKFTSRHTTILILVVLVGAIGFQLGYSWPRSNVARYADLPALIRKLVPTSTGGIDTFQAVWDELHQNYVDKKVDDNTLVQGAINGLVDSLQDPYTVYLSPAEAKEFQSEIDGVFDGVGMEMGMKNNHLTVISPLPDSPAAKAGLQAGDWIIGIDAQAAGAMKLDEAIKLIRGPRGTTVVIKVLRGTETESREFKVTRAKIVVETVTSKMLDIKDQPVGYLRVTGFNQDTGKLFQKLTRQLLTAGAKSFIIDLRNNPGGFLDQAVTVASVFIPDGVVVSEVGRDGIKNDLTATGNAFLSDQKTIVLINSGSASASEIVAGALQDTGHAKLVGTKTFGKGSVQQLVDLPDGAELKITIAKWLTPKGASITDQGIIPDVIVELTEADYENNRDPQLDKAQDLILQP